MGLIDTRDWIIASIKTEFTGDEKEIEEISLFLEKQTDDDYHKLFMDWSQKVKKRHIQDMTFSKYLLDRFNRSKKIDLTSTD